MATLYPRWQKNVVVEALRTRRVLLLSGPRQCGKTTLARQLVSAETDYRTLDDLAMRELAEIDPHGFVAHGSKTKAKPKFLETAFRLAFSKKSSRTFSRQDVLEMSFRGGFPEVIDMNQRERKRWHHDYVEALLERDLQGIARIQRHDAISELVKILAAWSSKYMDITAIGSGLSIRRPTVESYINALEALYLVERVRPWTKTDYERVGKHPKLFVTDSGLMASVLGWHMEQVALDSDRSGKLIETFVFNELSALIDASDMDHTLLHYRDREQREIDFVIEREDGALLGIEVKAGSAIKNEHFKHLRWFKENIAKEKPFVGIVLYTGEVAGSMADGMWAVPFNALWS